METLYLLVPMSLVLVVVIAGGSVALHAGQYDESRPSWRSHFADNDKPETRLTSGKSGTGQVYCAVFMRCWQLDKDQRAKRWFFLSHIVNRFIFFVWGSEWMSPPRLHASTPSITAS